MIHPTAASGFGSDAERYDRSRPGYPDGIVDHIAHLATGRVMDLAAGTGKLTRSLTDRGLAVTAVEPVAAMRAVLSSRCEDCRVVAGVAEMLPFADAAFSLVTVAQAFHWFDAPRVWGELARVVGPGGHVAILWNVREPHTDWQRRMWALMDDFERDAPWRRRGRETTSPPPSWNLVDQREEIHDVSTTVELLQDRFASVSAVAVLDERERARALDTVREIVSSAEPPLALRYRARLLVHRFGSESPAS